MASITTKQLSKLIVLIHDAALTPALWPEVLDEIRHQMAGSAALLLTPLHGQAAGGFAIPNKLSAETMARYAETYHRFDLWTQAGESRQLFTPGRVVTDEVRIPAQAGHGFQSKLDSDSDGSWTPIPGQAGQPEVIT